LPVPLAELVAQSTHVLGGVIRSVEYPVRPDLSDEQGVKVRLEVKPEWYLRGKPADLTKRRTIEFLLSPPPIRQLRKDDVVLWFLKEMPNGAMSFVGQGNGFFIVDAGAKPFPTAINLLENTALWRGSIESVAPLDVITAKLRACLEHRGIKEPELGARIKELLQFGKKADSRGPLPVDLLTALILATTR
jgi:hypothetical protein